MVLARSLLCSVLGAAGCTGEVNLDAVPGAGAGCEGPDERALVASPRMLPGRVCQACHVEGGQSRYAFTASGTVYGSPTDPCNTGGLDGVKVELLDQNDQVLIALFTNPSGNFFTAEPLEFASFRARVSKEGLVQQMRPYQTNTACATCHSPRGPAPGRIFLD